MPGTQTGLDFPSGYRTDLAGLLTPEVLTIFFLPDQLLHVDFPTSLAYWLLSTMLYIRILLLFTALGSCITWPWNKSLFRPPQAPTLDTSKSDLTPAKNKLHGRFLHITDIHPDPYYAAYTDVDKFCHRGKKTHDKTGIFGRPTSECDSPFSLVNATFDWIEQNLKDHIDFVIWTGDNARHDNDNKLPRSEKFIFDMNEQIVTKFKEVFGSDDPSKEFDIPIVPSLGNNDVYPHNVFPKGPNLQTRKLYRMWQSMVPEEQIHVFDRGVSFMVEVIPGKLAVLSINTLYWFRSNTLVDGCDGKKDPGHLLFRWLGIVLAELRARNMKVWLSGHVPPNEKLYEHSCLNRFTSWTHEYRDIIVGGVYGHMNIDHFLLLDSEAVTPDMVTAVKNWDEPEVTIQDKFDYLDDVRVMYDSVHKDPTRYAMAYVSPSVIPTYLPSLRVWEYNITGIDENAPSLYSNGSPFRSWSDVFIELGDELERLESADEYDTESFEEDESTEEDNSIEIQKKKHHKKKKKADPTWPPDFGNVAPGPAYVPQTFTPVRYVQYYADLEEANKAQNLTYQKEYTTDEPPYNMPSLLVKNWIKVARKLGAELSVPSSFEPGSDQAVLNGKKEKEALKKKSKLAWKKYLHYAFVSSGYESNKM